MSTTIQIDAPFLSVDEYARRTGQTIQSVSAQINRGQIPVTNFTEQGKRGKRFINMVALFKKADEPEFS